MKKIIRLRQLEKSYGTKQVLRGLDLDVAPGTILGFIGPNGAGKTTTVKILIGMLGDFSGRAEVCGIDVASDPLAVKRRVGYGPETPALYDTLSAVEFLEFVAEVHRLSASDSKRRAGRMLDLLGLGPERHQSLATYSKGMRQKVLIAAALLHDPELIVLDEPLSGLDANSAILIKRVLRGLAARGKTVFYCSHLIDVVERICDHVAIIDDGVIVAQGTFEELRAQSRASSLEALFAGLTSPGGQASAATEFVEIVGGPLS